jgi:ABC-type glycerol-3-phosphate transport system substrate-binding protein
MKKLTKRLLSLALTGAMCLSMTACGDKTSETTTGTGTGSTGSSATLLAQDLGYGYTSEYKDLDVDLSWINSNVSTAQGKLYIFGDYYDDAAGTSGTRLYAIDPDTGVSTEVPLPELTNTDTTSEYVQSISVCQDGSGYWMVSERYTWSDNITYYDDTDWDSEESAADDLTADTEEEAAAVAEETAAGDLAYHAVLLSDEAPVEDAEDVAEALEEDLGEAADEELSEDEIANYDDQVMPISDDDYQEPEDVYLATKCDMSGNVLQEIDLTEATQELDYFYPQYMAQNAAGDLIIASDSYILCMGADGSQKGTISLTNKWVQSMAATGDGTVVIDYYDSDSGELAVCTLEDGDFSSPMELTDVSETSSLSLYPGDGNTLLVSDGTYLYSVDAATGAATKLLSWLDSDINGSNLTGVVASGEDRVLVLTNKWNTRSGEQTYELGILTKTPADQLPVRTILTLGAVYLGDTLQDAVIDFNRKSDTYRITLVDYSSYNTDDDYQAGYKQLDLDVISGNCPDIISLESGSAEKYISKGVLADLSAMIEQDDSISMDDLLSGPLQAYTKDGKLYGMPQSFSLYTLIASKTLVGDRTSWTMEEMGDVIDSLDEDTQVMSYWTNGNFLTEMTYMNQDHFVDYGTASCSFDSDEFQRLLEVSKKLPTEDELYGDDTEVSVWTDEWQEIQNGNTLMTQDYVSYTTAVKELYGLYTEENGFVNIGFPTASGNGAMLGVSGGMAISAKSQNQEGAWEFIKTMLSDDIQSDGWGFPVTVSAFDEMMAETMEQPYYMDGDEKVYYDDTSYIGDTEYSLDPLTQEQLDEFKEYINGATISGNYDSDIIDIITEEAAAYYSGDKSAEEVTKLIQNRVSIYLGETS